MLSQDKILIIKFGAIGDCVLTTPAVRAIRNIYKKSFITYLVGEKANQVFKGNPNIDEIVIFTEKHYFPRITNLLRYCLNRELIKKLKSFKFDLVIDFESSYKSYYISALAKTKNRLGFSLSGRRGYLDFLYNYGVKPGSSVIYQVDRYLELISNPPCNIVTEDIKTEVFVSQESRNYIEKFLAEYSTVRYGNKSLVGMNPATLAVSKRWPKENYAKLADIIIDKFGADIIFTWGPGELDYIKEIERLMKKKPVIAPQTDINQLAVLIEKCNLFITNDTAPMHIAKALEVPTIAFFGPTNPEVWACTDDKFIVVKAKDISCGPCDDFNCKTPVCMDKITVEEVGGIVSKFLK